LGRRGVIVEGDPESRGYPERPRENSPTSFSRNRVHCRRLPTWCARRGSGSGRRRRRTTGRASGQAMARGPSSWSTTIRGAWNCSACCCRERDTRFKRWATRHRRGDDPAGAGRRWGRPLRQAHQVRHLREPDQDGHRRRRPRRDASRPVQVGSGRV